MTALREFPSAKYHSSTIAADWDWLVAYEAVTRRDYSYVQPHHLCHKYPRVRQSKGNNTAILHSQATIGELGKACVGLS